MDQRCQRLRQELAEAELQRMTVAYSNHIDVKAVTTIDVKAVAGSVGPLLRGCSSGRVSTDTGSPATIMSFELFKTIGKAANISSNSLLPIDLDFTLKNYRGLSQ